MPKKRINELTEATSVKTDHYIPVDHGTDGTQKMSMATLIDSTLAVSGKAADAKAAGDAIATEATARAAADTEIKEDFAQISEVTPNLFNITDVQIGKNHTGASNPSRAISADIYSDTASITVKAYNLPSNLKYDIELYSTDDISTRLATLIDWTTDTNEHTTANLQATYKHFRVLFGSVNNGTLTASDFEGLKLQVNVGSTILEYTPHFVANDSTARAEIEKVRNSIDDAIGEISEPTDNLFVLEDVQIGKNAVGGSASARAISGDMYSDVASITVKAYNLPSNLKYDIELYSSDSFSSRVASIGGWITDTDSHTTINDQATYKHFRLLFGSVNNNALTTSDFDGLIMQVNAGGAIYNYQPLKSAVDSDLRDMPVKIRVMQYNIGHFCYGLGSSFDEIGLPAELYDEKVEGMKEFFAKYQPDVLGLSEYWEYLDNAKTHKSDDVLFDPILPYKNQSTHWNALKSDYELFANSNASLGGSGQQYMKSDICVNGKTIGLMVVHFGLTEQSRVTEMTNALAVMDDYENAIIMGDFNTDTSSDRTEIFGMAQEAGYTLSNGGYFGWKNTWNYTNPDRPIDNILFKGRIKLKDYQVLSDEVDNLCSDHMPTYADLVIY